MQLDHHLNENFLFLYVGRVPFGASNFPIAAAIFANLARNSAAVHSVPNTVAFGLVFLFPIHDDVLVSEQW